MSFFFAFQGDGNFKSCGPESVTVESVPLTVTESTPIVFMTENPGGVNFENTQPLDSEHKGFLDKLFELWTITKLLFLMKCQKVQILNCHFL